MVVLTCNNKPVATARIGIVKALEVFVCSAKNAPKGVLIANSTRLLIIIRFDSFALLSADATSSAIGILWNARDQRKPC